MAEERQRHLLYKWNKHGSVYVYEGKHGIAVGNKTAGYSVFTSKKGIGIEKGGTIVYSQKNGYVGNYAARGKASSLVRAVDKAMSRSGKVTTIHLTGGGSPIEAFSQGKVRKGRVRGGGLIVYSDEDEVGLIHEQSHAELGHITMKGKEKYVSKISREKQAVRLEIKILKEKGKYTRKVRTSVIRDLSTYFRDRLRKTRLKKAKEFIEKVENEDKEVD